RPLSFPNLLFPFDLRKFRQADSAIAMEPACLHSTHRNGPAQGWFGARLVPVWCPGHTTFFLPPPDGDDDCCVKKGTGRRCGGGPAGAAFQPALPLTPPAAPSDPPPDGPRRSTDLTSGAGACWRR